MESKGLDVSKAYVTSSYIVSAVTVITALSLIGYGCWEYHRDPVALVLILAGGVVGMLLLLLLVQFVYFACWFGVCYFIDRDLLRVGFDDMDNSMEVVEYEESDLSKMS